MNHLTSFDIDHTLALNTSSLCGAVHQNRIAGYQFPCHLHTTIEIYLITSGNCYMDIAGEKVCCDCGDFIMILPNTVHSFYLDQLSGCEFQHIHFYPELFSHLIINEDEDFSISLTDSLLFHCNFYYKQRATPTLTHLVDNVISCYQQHRDCFDTVAENLFLAQIMLYVLKNITKNTLQSSDFRTQNKYISYTLRYISEHYSEKILIEDIANELNISRRYLGKIFSEHMNLSLANYINVYRINRAIDLMTNTDSSLLDIALAIGLNDSQHFSKLFYKIIGITPHKYRKIIERQDIPPGFV